MCQDDVYDEEDPYREGWVEGQYKFIERGETGPYRGKYDDSTDQLANADREYD